MFIIKVRIHVTHIVIKHFLLYKIFALFASFAFNSRIRIITLSTLFWTNLYYHTIYF